MFKFYSIFKPPSKYSHIIFPLKGRIDNFIYKHNYKKCYYMNCKYWNWIGPKIGLGSSQSGLNNKFVEHG